MDMNYLVQRKINAKKAYRKKVILTVVFSAILLVLIVAGLLKVIWDEKKAEENVINNGINVTEDITPELTGNESGNSDENNGEDLNGGKQENIVEATPVPTEPPATATPTSTPVLKKKVAVDAGHGGNVDLGSSRPSEKQYEKNANLALTCSTTSSICYTHKGWF